MYATSLIIAHVLATTVGFALADHRSITGETADVVLHYPDVLAATVAMALFVAVGVSSATAVRRRLSYHTWYFLHLYVYIALVLSFAHELATGNDFVSSRWHRVVWVGVHLITIGLLVTYRVLTPAVRALRHRLRVDRVVQEADGVVSVYVTGRHLDRLEAQSGQFFLWRFLTRQGWWQAHPFSLSAPPSRSGFRITIKRLGDHTNWLQTVEPGTAVIAEGPFGAITPQRRTTRNVLFLAGGIGVTPLRALFQSLPADRGRMTFLYRAGSEADLVFRGELEELARMRGAKLFYAVGPRAHGTDDPLHPTRLRSFIGKEACDVFVCGPAGFVDHAVSNLRKAGVPRRLVHAERFAL
jgi:predicted ferric reductase